MRMAHHWAVSAMRWLLTLLNCILPAENVFVSQCIVHFVIVSIGNMCIFSCPFFFRKWQWLLVTQFNVIARCRYVHFGTEHLKVLFFFIRSMPLLLSHFLSLFSFSFSSVLQFCAVLILQQLNVAVAIFAHRNEKKKNTDKSVYLPRSPNVVVF